MLRADKLKGRIVERGYSQFKVAERLGITPKTFYCKMKTGNFSAGEIAALIDLLEIEEPMEIFFCKEENMNDTTAD